MYEYNNANFYNPTPDLRGLFIDNNNVENRYNFSDYYKNNHWVSIDNWLPEMEDVAFMTIKNAIIVPTISKYYQIPDDDLNAANINSFIMTSKRCYNGDDIRKHICFYLNYFCKFYDKDKELLTYYTRIKRMIDFGVTTFGGVTHTYTKEEFISDIVRYILGPTMYDKVHQMNEQNYSLNLIYKNKTNQALQYNNTHGKIFMEISVFMVILIPLISHFIYRNKITSETDELFQTIYQFLFDRYEDSVDLKAKLYETANTTIARDQRTNKDLWDKSEIRGMDISVNSLDAVDTLVLQVIPKYKYNQNMIMYNFTSIRNTAIQYAVGIAYEYDLVPLSSSKRDGEDSTSQFDKFEATLGKADESKFIQNKVNAETTMKLIENKYGPFTEDLIEFYRYQLSKGAKPVINTFQFKLIMIFFGKLFGSVLPMKTINLEQYIELIITAKRKLLNKGLAILPYIISGRVVKLTSRTTLNRKEITMIESSENWEKIKKKYMYNEQTLDQIRSTIATIISSDFEIIQYDMENKCATQYNGKSIKIDSYASQIVIEECLEFYLMI